MVTIVIRDNGSSDIMLRSSKTPILQDSALQILSQDLSSPHRTGHSVFSSHPVTLTII